MSLTSLQLKLINIAARGVRYARAITFQLAEVTVLGHMVRAILAAMHQLARGAVVRLTAIQTQSERKRQDKSTRRAEKLHHRAGIVSFAAQITTHSGALTITAELGSTRRLIRQQDQVLVMLAGMPLGECRIERQAGFQNVEAAL